MPAFGHLLKRSRFRPPPASVLLCFLAVSPLEAQQKTSAVSFDKHIIPLMEKYCYDCHGDGVSKGDLTLDTFTTEGEVLKDRALWDTVMYQVDNFVMPPSKEKTQPTVEERALISHYLDNLLYYTDCSNPDPGRVTIRRLNRSEYNNTIRDLIGLDLRPADDFPEDDSGYGFDNIGDVLSLPPVLMERYLIAADKALDSAIVTGPPVAVTRKFTPSLLKGGQRKSAKERLLKGSEEISIEHKAAFGGGYVFNVHARTENAGTRGVPVVLKIDGKAVHSDVVRGGTGSEFAGKATLEPGKHTFSVTSEAGGELVIAYFLVKGPYNAEEVELPPSHKRIFITDDRDRPAAARIIRNFANRAFRRPVQTGEVNRLLQFFDEAMGNKETFETAIKVTLKAVMVSPHFLFRMEWQPNPNDPASIFDVTEYALATRLSYFLWSSMPDDELLSLAFKKQLRSNLTKQVKRMLADPKASALAENFGGQWLEIRNMRLVMPDKQRFPDFNDALRASMLGETVRLFHHIQTENKSVLDFLTADYTFVDGRLAKLYGIPAVTGDAFQKVSLKNTPRRGVLTHASVLTVSSEPTRTSPVKRGKWVLENLLGTPPPPPPPNVPPLDESDDELKGSLRERLEQHRENPACYSCHNLMDPIGFGLENFDAIGAWRTRDGSHPVEALGILNSGEKFTGSLELNKIILDTKKERFVECLIRKMLTYALGRGLEYYDKCAVEDIRKRLEKENHAFEALVMGIVESTPFQKRRGDGFVEKAN